MSWNKKVQMADEFDVDALLEAPYTEKSKEANTSDEVSTLHSNTSPFSFSLYLGINVLESSIDGGKV